MRRGRPPKLDEARWHALGLDRALAGPPAAAGFPDLDAWSLAAVAALIERRAGIRYHRRHVSRLLRRRGWTVPPIGSQAAHARRTRPVTDPDGNRVQLVERLR